MRNSTKKQDTQNDGFDFFSEYHFDLLSIFLMHSEYQFLIAQKE
jgi:hypothetical protein